MQRIRILLANHQPLIRSGLRLLLEREPDFQVVAEAANGREAIVLTEFKHPDVVLLEVKLPYLNGIAVTREISSKNGCSKQIFVTADTDEAYVIEALKAGARGFVAEDSAPVDLAHAIHVVSVGRMFLSPAICMRFLEGHLRNGDISQNEMQVCCLLVAGYGEREIAERLNTDLTKVRIDCRSIGNALRFGSLPEPIVRSVSENRRAVEVA